MKESEPTFEQFKAMLRYRVLDPAEQDIIKMHAVWCLLIQHLEKQQTAVQSVKTKVDDLSLTLQQSIFNPTYLSAGETGERFVSFVSSSSE